ncbi:restriction endonuclease subunit S [Nocardia otitidiscaviarum]|uniref:restriction endonuclease subunit S n=1 Tax=Nocardia otitidiscaviarum TaxID=1823 RepID=UPI0009DD3451|nr:restriction endonuclease subunit S [Nocardia otitidiscaviarum]MBF6134774.1 restriction endonuclease subunit S [Nocardia otitidiscaviarum]MBF6485600.1 restriction endonuclease subunit S [Nocardia otitidiscaviarum]
MSRWVVRSLGEVATITRNSVAPEDIQPELPYLSLDSIESGGRICNVRTAGDAGIESQKFKFTSSQVLFGKLRPYLAKIARPDFEGVCSTDILPITPGPTLDRNFLAHFLAQPSMVELASTRSTGANLPRLSPAELGKFFIPMPSLGEQRRIAEVLDRVDALREKRRRAIALLEDLAQSIFLDMFGDPTANSGNWPRVPFGYLLDKIDSGSSPKCLDRPARDNEWAVLKLSAVTSCRFIPTENKAIPPGVTPAYDDEVRPGDLLFSRKNTPTLVAACVFVRDTPSRLLMPDLIFRFRFKSGAEVVPLYIHQLLVNPEKRRKVQELAGGSAASMSNISKARLVNLPIELPPLDLQREFAKRIDALERSRQVHITQLGDLDALFASLQSRAFRGEL